MKYILSTVLAVCSVQCFCAPDKVLYELQERCGKSASAEFKREFGTGINSTKQGTTVTNFRNHYNAKLNACMYLLLSDGFSKDAKGKAGPSLKSQTLFDLNENHEIATLWMRQDRETPMQCEVKGQTCTSQKEFESLIKPLMED